MLTKPKCHTSQEVKAECEAKRKALEARIHELEDVKHLLAQMNAAKDVEDEEMDGENPQCLSAAVFKWGYTEVASNSSDEEEFDFEGVNAMPDLSDNEQPAKGRAVSIRSHHRCKNSQKACRSRNPRKCLKALSMGRFKIWLRGYMQEAMMGMKARELKQPFLIISKFVDFLMSLINQSSDSCLGLKRAKEISAFRLMKGSEITQGTRNH